jgi:Fe-S oxidoreductase
VDIAGLKAEFSYQYQEANGYSLRNRLFAHNTAINAFNSNFSALLNPLLNGKFSSSPIKSILGVSKKRSIPLARRFDFGKFLARQKSGSPGQKGRVALFIDEFTRYLDIQQGKDAIYLLEKLGYDVQLFIADSGRSFISKGFLKQARKLAHKNALALHALSRDGVPLLGLEPSAVLTFRDEYKRFGLSSQISDAIAKNCFLIEEFLASEIEKGKLSSNRFTTREKEVKIHNHCYQKALSNQKVTFDVLNLPQNYKVSIIASGCCGMAGSFGYEKEHYEVSMQVGGLKLFPAVRKADDKVLIAANGTSCRHQIADGTGRKALHPVSILREALAD